MELRVRKDLITFFLLSLPFVFFVGLRGGTPDTQIYFDVFKSIGTLDLLNPIKFYFETGMEIGFGWFSWLISQFSTSSLILFSLFSLLNFYFIYLTCRELNLKYIYALFFYIPSQYFFLQQFMQMRQGLAVSIVVYAAVKALNRQKLTLSTALLFVLAFSFHQVSIALIAAFFLFYIFKNNVLTSRIAFMYVYWISFVVLVLLCKFLILDLVIGASGRLQDYANTDLYAADISLFSLPNIRTFLILLFLTFFAGEHLKQSQIYRFFLYLMFVAMAVRIGFSDFAIMSGRLATAFSYVEIFALPLLMISRFKPFPAIALSLIYFILLIIVTLHFQAPYLLEMYGLPLY